MKILKLFLISILFLFFFLTPQILLADTPCDNKSDSEEKVKCLIDLMAEYEGKIKDLQGKQKTLATTIGVLDSQIILAQTQIRKTEEEVNLLQEEIGKLSIKIEKLSYIVADVSTLLASRIEETYKRSFLPQAYLFFSSSGFSDFVSRLKYLKMIQQHDREVLFSLEEAKQNYDIQKDLKKEKQKELETLQEKLETQKVLLAQQKANKQKLLQVTKNDEQNFQNLLAKTRAEFEAIQSILAGFGEETKIGDIKEGEKIASIISGGSACSTGTHLHFEIAKSGANINPASMLKSKDVEWDLCGWYGCDGPFGFSGSWEWPINGKPRITQGYGMTAYARSGAYGGNPHTGIDMLTGDLSIKAVRPGVLYRGSIACGGGTLRYVKVDHKDSDVDTYYLHINYVK